MRPLLCLAFALVSSSAILTGCANTQPRTVDAARQEFDNGTFKVGKATTTDVRNRLGSPSDIKKLGGGEECWHYLKNVPGPFWKPTADLGTIYAADYTFDGKGILKDASYSASPMSNPLVR